MALRRKAVRSRMMATLDAFSDTETLDSLQKAAHFVGCGASYDKGEKVPNWQLPILKIQGYNKTRLCLLYVSAGLRSAAARLESFDRSGALRAAVRLRSLYGQRIALVATLAIFRRGGEDGIGLPLPDNFIRECAKHMIKVGVVVYC